MKKIRKKKLSVKFKYLASITLRISRDRRKKIFNRDFSVNMTRFLLQSIRYNIQLRCVQNTLYKSIYLIIIMNTCKEIFKMNFRKIGRTFPFITYVLEPVEYRGKKNI